MGSDEYSRTAHGAEVQPYDSDDSSGQLNSEDCENCEKRIGRHDPKVISNSNLGELAIAAPMSTTHSLYTT